MTEKRKLVMATNNAGKLREARAIAGDKLEILSLGDIGFNQDIEETADTLAGNALIKVRAIKEVTDLDVFADDTGLMVEALGGAPGVHTARYAGEDCNPDANIDLMLKNLEGVDNRTARFSTCIALSLDGEEHIFEGSAEGSIATHRSGNHGFGYDPIFISAETGKCFAEMTDEEKNAISHRSRSLHAMMKWLGTLCLLICGFLPAMSSSSADWMIYNTFDDKIESVFDTPEKTYFLTQAQFYEPSLVDNNKKLAFLYGLDKESGEIRPYNIQNFLSNSLIRIANYNAQKRYLLIVYDDMMIDLLYDDGSLYPIPALKNYQTSSSKEVRSISFDPDNNRAYLATDFGYLEINDDKKEVAASGIYGHAFDYVARVSDYLIVVADGKILADDVSDIHLSFDDFTPMGWNEGEQVLSLRPLSSTKCVVSRIHNGTETFYVISFDDSVSNPNMYQIGTFHDSKFAENQYGLLADMSNRMVSILRESGQCEYYTKREEDYGTATGSWDFKDYYFAKSREGFYSLRREADDSWTITSQLSHPNSPSAFRSNFMRYVPEFGMLVNSHGIDRNFSSHLAQNPILLSSLKDGVWKSHGIPYFDASQATRLINPCGFAQDPDNPDVFYFGSVKNGLIRYNIKDFSSLLHMTRSDDNPNAPGHVALREPYSFWGSVMMLLNPRFDKKGNLIVAHVNTETLVNKSYTVELWIWTPEKRRASTSPETFQPFKILNVDKILTPMSLLAFPLESSSSSNMIPVFPINNYDEPFVIYDHNGTPDDETDDRQVVVSSLYDQDGKLTYHYIYCAIEDPATGLVWVGTDNGVFTMNPAQQFSTPGSVNRIKVSRNDGTSLADYLLDGIGINDISIDGNGRKWFSLGGGGIVCTSADGKTIIDEITSDNSLLPSDNVYATCYNPESNSLMVASEAGLCQYYFSTQSVVTESSVRAYPNPVGPDYYGWVTIDGLEDDCIVKIADSAGNVIRELGPASGGKIQWDACNANLDRVASGVYFVLASSGPGGGSYSEVTKVLVVKK